MSTSCWTQSPQTPRRLASSPLFLLLVACIWYSNIPRHCFKNSLVFWSGSGLDFMSAGCWTQSLWMSSRLTSSPLFLLLVACIDTVTWRLRDVCGKRLARTRDCWCQIRRGWSQTNDLTRTSLRFHPLGLNHLFYYHYYALSLCAQFPQEFRNFSKSLANPPSSSMPSLFSAKNCSRMSKSHLIQWYKATNCSA